MSNALDDFLAGAKEIVKNLPVDPDKKYRFRITVEAGPEEGGVFQKEVFEQVGDYATLVGVQAVTEKGLQFIRGTLMEWGIERASVFVLEEQEKAGKKER